jgi:glycosyltransferase involved in cell wall biosynthesis
VIARLNAGGPAHHVGLLSSRLGSPYQSLLVHGRVGAEEAPLDGFDERYPAERLELQDLGPHIRPVSDVRTLLQLMRIARRFRPHVVHTHTAKAGLIGRSVALCLRPRPVVVHTFHGHVLEGYFSPMKTGFYRALERLLGRVSDGLIGVSDATVADLARLGVGTPDSRYVIRLGLDLVPFLDIGPSVGGGFRREVGCVPEETLAIMVGRLVPIKRHDLALRAVALAHGDKTPVRLAIVGDGPLRPALERLTRELGIADRVHFLGFRGDIVSITAAADVALLSSANEGTPVALIEAAAAGIPAVATDVGGVTEVVSPATGLIVPPEDAEALGAALATLASDVALRAKMGDAARSHVADRYAAARLLQDVDALYADLLTRRGPLPIETA